MSNFSSEQFSLSYLNRDVVKSGWLKYIPFAERLASNQDKFWVVFAVYDQNLPYLEFYKNNSIPNNPISKHALGPCCRYITSVISLKDFEFTIALHDYVIRLSADTAEIMLDWTNVLIDKLVSMHILLNENIYSENPENNSHASQNPGPSASTERSSDELYEPIFTNISQRMQQLSVNNSFLPLEEGPPPYEIIFNQNEQQTTYSFRENQVKTLKEEMQMLPGLKLKLRRKDYYSIAFVDVFSYGAFIAGYKQQKYSHWQSKYRLCIGDQLISINNIIMGSASQAHAYIKQCPNVEIEIIIRRVPFGQIYCLKRSYDGEELGIVRKNGTSEITHIIPNSIASKAGVLSKCNFEENESNENVYLTSLCITEVNNRPLNLFFKNNEVKDRLNALGKEISILVQPYPFVRRLRKQLKAFKNYKDYIVQ